MKTFVAGIVAGLILFGYFRFVPQDWATITIALLVCIIGVLLWMLSLIKIWE